MTSRPARPTRTLSVLAVAITLSLAAALLAAGPPSAATAATERQVGRPALTDPSLLLAGVRQAVAGTKAQPTCSLNPPYDCTKKQMWRQARGHRGKWFKKQRFDGAKTLLTGLSDKERRRVTTAMRKEVKAHVRKEKRQDRVAAGESFDAARWTTGWRGRRYTVKSFPYKKYVSHWTGQVSHGWLQCVSADYRLSYEIFARNWCDPRPPNSNDEFMLRYARSMASSFGVDTKWSCKKEVIIATIGTMTFYGGPLTAAKSALRNGGRSLVACITYKLGNLAEWW